MTTKIAVVTENGTKISSHFGQAPFYKVFTVDNGTVITEEQREKFHHGDHNHHEHGQHQHDSMLAPITDCQVLISGGMGEPAFAKAQAANLEIFLVGGMIADAIQACLAGEIQSDLRRLHKHHSHKAKSNVIAADDLLPGNFKNK